MVLVCATMYCIVDFFFHQGYGHHRDVHLSIRRKRQVGIRDRGKDMFDPDLNAAYAARLLRDLYDGPGSWADAVGDYHSRDPDLGGAYMMRVGATLAELQASNTGAAAPAPADRPRRNGFPLLAGGLPTTGASLFPRLSGGTPLIGAP